MKYNFDKLDKTKKYALYFVPENVKFLSAHWFIQRKAKQTLKKYKIDDLKEGIATHSAMLVWLEAHFYKNDYYSSQWWIYESHFKTGVVRYPARKIDTESDIYAYEEDFRLEQMNDLLGRPYGKLDMLGFANEYLGIKNSRWHKLDRGEFCTEYLIKCLTLDGYKKYMLFYDPEGKIKLKTYQYEPVMQQNYALQSGKEIIKL